MKKVILIIVMLIVISACGILIGQVRRWDIVTVSNQPYSGVILHDLSDDSLYIKSYGNVIAIPLDSIKYLRGEKPSLSAVGFIFGMTVGGIIGYERSIRRSEFYHGFDVMIGMVGGGLVGFILGEAIGADEYCYVRSKSHEEKIRELRKLIDHSKSKD